MSIHGVLRTLFKALLPDNCNIKLVIVVRSSSTCELCIYSSDCVRDNFAKSKIYILYLRDQMEKTNSIFEDDFISLCDGSIKTDDGEVFKIHKYVLAKGSGYFKTLFCRMKQNDKDFVIEVVSGEVMMNILRFLYNGTICITHRNFLDLIIVADYLGVHKLLADLNNCLTDLSKKLSVGNSTAIFMAAKIMNRQDILEESFRFIETNFEEVACSESEDFCEMPVDSLKKLLSGRNLKVRNETAVWLAIVRWVESDLLARLHYVPDLLIYIAFENHDEHLVAEILHHNIVANNEFFKAIYTENGTSTNSLKFRQWCIWNSSHQPLPFNVSRIPLRLNFIARYSSIGNNEFENDTDARTDRMHLFVTYDENLDLWRKITERECSRICEPQLLSVGDYIYWFESYGRTKQRFSIVEKEWFEVSDLTHQLNASYIFLKLQGLIYALDADARTTVDGTAEVIHVEIFDSDKNAWKVTSPMLPMHGYSATTLNDCIYVVGYNNIHDGEQWGLEMVSQVYDPKTKMWKEFLGPFVERSEFALVGYRGKLYVIGGLIREKSGDPIEVTDVEVFDPGSNTWSSIASLPTFYDYDPVAQIIDDKLIVHQKARSSYLFPPPAQWNPDSETWDTAAESSPFCNIHNYHFFTLEEGESMIVLAKENKEPSTVFEKSPFSRKFNAVSGNDDESGL